MLITVGLMTGLLAWGAYLAIGAWQFNRDIRKGAIVFACSLAFLGLWSIVLAVASRTEGVASAGRGDRNWLCLIACCVSVLAVFSMAIPVTGIAPGIHRISVLVALWGIAAGGLLSIIGLSDRDRTTWKSLGLLAIVLLGGALLIGFALPT